MWRKVLVLTVVLFLIGAAPAAASFLSAEFGGMHGQNTVAASSPCATGLRQWHASWSNEKESQPLAPFTGTWSGTFDVTDADARKAYIANNAGHLAVDLAGRGTAYFDVLGNGSCQNAVLDLTTQADGDPQVTGTVPFVGAGGTDALRGLTGSGTADLDLELGAGADNIAGVQIQGSFDVPDPAVSVTGVSARYASLVARLKRQLTVVVTVTNAAAAGDAFDLRITGSSGGLVGAPTATVVRVSRGTSTRFTFTLPNAAALHRYDVRLSSTLVDAVSNPVPPPALSFSFIAPLL